MPRKNLNASFRRNNSRTVLFIKMLSRIYSLTLLRMTHLIVLGNYAEQVILRTYYLILNHKLLL